MKQFTYTIKDEIGIHARPAGILVKAAKQLGSVVTVEYNGKSAVATKLMAIMGLGVKHGDTVTVKVDGPTEETDAAQIEDFFTNNL
jgi:phosphocarrier protein